MAYSAQPDLQDVPLQDLDPALLSDGSSMVTDGFLGLGAPLVTPEQTDQRLCVLQHWHNELDSLPSPGSWR